MLDAIHGIRLAVEGLDFPAFERAWVIQRAVERGLEIISEASRHLPATAQAAHPEVPWRQVAGIGNILRHDYQRVEPRLIWNLLDAHLPVLEGAVSAILAAMPDADPSGL